MERYWAAQEQVPSSLYGGRSPRAVIDAESVKEQVGAKASARVTQAPAGAGGHSSFEGSLRWP